MLFLERLQEIAKEKCLTVTAIAEGSGVPRSTVSSYFNRKSTPSAIQLEQLADFFDCSVDYLIGRTDEFDIKTETNAQNLRADERELLKFYNELTDVRRESVVDSVRGMAMLQKVNRSQA